ncbi:hypothetical protein ABK040_004692 [Willaertia magna]
MLRDEMVDERKWINNQQFINGLSLSTALPGVRYNLAAFYGAIISSNTTGNTNTTNTINQYLLSTTYGIAAGVSFHLPGYLTMIGCLPLWSIIRNLKFIKKAIIGVNAVCVGYVITTILQLWMNNVGESPYLSANSILCLVIVWFFDFYPPVVVLFSAVVGIVMGQIKGGEIL